MNIRKKDSLEVYILRSFFVGAENSLNKRYMFPIYGNFARKQSVEV